MLFALLFVVTRLIQPGYGAGDFGSLVRAVLPYAFAVAAQTIVVIAGGIDLSVASMMALTSVTAAAMMDGASEEYALFVVPFVLLHGPRARRDERHPDRRDARARHRRHAGDAVRAARRCAAGARRARRRRGRMAEGADRRHHFHSRAYPKASPPGSRRRWSSCSICLGIVWMPLQRSRLGLSIYAIGSSELAAFRSGVSVARTRIIAYAAAGFLAAMGGLTLTMSTGIGAPIPGPYLLASVAAVVLGGVTLGGGRGGLVGPIVAVFVLRLVRTDLTLLAVDPNVTSIVEGTIMVVVVMLGAFIAMRRRSP